MHSTSAFIEVLRKVLIAGERPGTIYISIITLVQPFTCLLELAGVATMIEQVPFGTNKFSENPEPRLPCVLLLDVSGSMSGPPIAELNAGLTTYKDALAAGALANAR